MSTPPTSNWLSTRTLGRVCIAVGGVGVFLFAARSIDPGSSMAAPTLPSAPTLQESVEPANESLGRFQAVDHTIHVVATPEGPRYTVTDEAGNILETQLEDDELYSALESHGLEPGMPTDNAAGALMLADEDEFSSLLD